MCTGIAQGPCVSGTGRYWERQEGGAVSRGGRNHLLYEGMGKGMLVHRIEWKIMTGYKNVILQFASETFCSGMMDEFFFSRRMDYRNP